MDWDPDVVLGFGARVVLFGGNTDTGQINDTWLIDGGAWNQCTTCNPTVPPLLTNRCCVGLAYFPNVNAALKGIIMYGGQVFMGGTKVTLAGTWRFDGTTWACVAGSC